MYEYRAKVVKVYDGDTITVDIDLGLKCWVMGVKLRLSRINAPEIRGKDREEGFKSRDKLADLILDQWVTIRTKKDKTGKYGRYLAEVVLNNINVNEWMVQKGLAEVY